MNKDLKQLLAKKAAQLDLARGDALSNIQKLLDSRYPNQTRAKSLHNGVLKIITPSAAVASELRLRQVQLIKDIVQQASHGYGVERLLIQIATI